MVSPQGLQTGSYDARVLARSSRYATRYVCKLFSMHRCPKYRPAWRLLATRGRQTTKQERCMLHILTLAPFLCSVVIMWLHASSIVKFCALSHVAQE